MPDRLDAELARIFARVDRVLDAIEAGDLAARGPVDQLHAAAPWDLVKLGHAFALDALERDAAADEDFNAGTNRADR